MIDVMPVISEGLALVVDTMNSLDTMRFSLGDMVISVLDVAFMVIVISSTLSTIFNMISENGDAMDEESDWW